jgi:hypothetical protein
MPGPLDIVRAAIGPLDHAGLVDGGRIGIVLQGANVERTARIAVRISLRLNNASVLPPGHRAAVYVATGTGRNAATLPVAATCELPESS